MNNISCRVLLVEDDENEFLVMRALLSNIITRQFDLEWADSLQAARQLLSQHGYDVCLLDYRLDGVSTLELLSESSGPALPFILLTDNEEYETDVAAAQAGAADYLVKRHINAPLLERSIRYAIERKKTEASLLQAQRFAQATVDALPDNIAVLDSQGTIVAVNAAWRDFADANGFIGANYGIGTNYLDVCRRSNIPDARDTAEGIRAVTTGQKETFCLDYPCHTPTEQRWFKVCVTRFTGEGPMHIVVAHENISERKRADARLRQSSELLRAVTEGASDAIFAKDREGRYLMMNSAGARLLGKEGENLVGRRDVDIIPPEAAQTFAATDRRILENGEIQTREEEVTVDGTTRTYLATKGPLLGTNGEVRGIVGISRDITEHRQAQVGMARLAAIVESSNDAIISKTLDGIITSWNAGAEALYGYTASEAISHPVSMLLPPDRPGEEMGLLKRIAQGGRVTNYETIRVCKDDRRLEVSLTLSPLKNEAGEIIGASAISRDISDRKRAERALRASEERFRAFMDNTPARVFMKDHAGRYVYLNKAIEQFRQTSASELLGETVFDRLPPHIAEPLHRHDMQVFASGQAQQFEEVVESFDGRLHHEAVVKFVLPDAEGGQLLAGVAVDVTEQKQAENERDRFFTMSLDMQGIAGFDGYFKRLNPAFSKVLGFSEAELLARSFLDWVHPDDRAMTVAAFERLSATGLLSDFENRYYHKDGSLRWLQWKAVASVEEGVIYAAARDVTERKAAEAALLQMRDELELRVEERTVELGQSNATLQSEILERERAEREVRVQARQHEAIAELGRQALLDTDLDALLQSAVALISTTLDVDICSFWERLPGTDILRLRTGVGLIGEVQPPPERKIGDDSHLGYSAFINQPVISEDLEHETRFGRSPFLRENGIVSTIAVPVHDDVLYGIVSACSTHKQKFHQNEIFFLQTATNVLSSAIVRKRAAAEIIQLNTDLQGVNDALRANEARLLQGNQITTDLMRLRVRTHDEFQESLHQITQSASAMLDIERSSVWLFNEDGTVLRCHDLYERSQRRHSNGMELPEDEHYFPAIKAQRVIVADDARTDPATRDYWESYLEPNGITSILDVALVVGGKHVGVLCSEHVGLLREWQAEDRIFASAVASVCSTVLESYERTNAENALQEAKEEAEHATEEANAANLAKSEFLSRMSHELRTPLNAILGFGQILEMRGGDAKQLGNIQQILKAGRHLLSLINEVLDIARIEAGHLSLSLEPIHAGIVVREALDLVRPLASDRKIELVNQVVGEDAARHLLADQQRLKQVLLNLLSNAVKYNHEGGSVFVGCEITLTTPMLREGIQIEGRLRFLVRDTGAGLSPEDISRLFVPFERLGAARSQIEGTGIGLTLCKRLVEAMNGQIGVVSEEGQGSTFWVELPLVSSPLQQVDQVTTGSLAPVEVSTLENLGTVLYIEDNLSNISLVESALSEQDYQVRLLTAMQGSVGLELASQHHPDLILLDVHLPDIMGDVVLHRLKEDAATRDIPVVVLSADATPSQVERLMAGGAKAYLTKPLDLKQFFNVLEQVLKRAE